MLRRVVNCLGIVAKSGHLFGHCCQEWSTVRALLPRVDLGYLSNQARWGR